VTLTLTQPQGDVTTHEVAAPLVLEVCAADQRARVMSEWKQLEQSLAPVAISCSAAWVECWLDHFGNLIRHQFVIARRGDVTKAVLLLTTDLGDRRSLLPITTWHFGTAGELDRDSVCVEYNDWLCVPAEKDAVLSALLNSREPSLAGDRWKLDGFAAIDLPDTVSAEAGWQCDRRLARYLDLRTIRESGRELITFFGDSTRKHIRQNIRDYGQIQTEWTDTVAAAHAAFDEQIALHQERWTLVGEPGCYASRRFTAFHRELIDRLVPTGQMTVVRVRAGDTTLGASQLLMDRGRILVYQGGRLANSGKHSPGLITDYMCMLESLRRGYDAFDFMAGDSQHKQRMTTHSAPLVWAEKRLPGWKLPVLDALRSLKRNAQGWMTSQPTVHASVMGAKEE
jgi:hypothetical protein